MLLHGRQRRGHPTVPRARRVRVVGKGGRQQKWQLWLWRSRLGVRRALRKARPSVIASRCQGASGRHDRTTPHRRDRSQIASENVRVATPSFAAAGGFSASHVLRWANDPPDALNKGLVP